MALTLSQAIQIKNNNYQRADSCKKHRDFYDGVSWSRKELDQYIYKLQAKYDDRVQEENEREYNLFLERSGAK